MPPTAPIATEQMPSQPRKKAKKGTETTGDVAASEGACALSAELIARIATFAPRRNSARADSELLRICLATGPLTSTLIRHTYLKDNDGFLLDVMGRCIHLGGRVAHKEKCRDDILAWIAVNSDWKTERKRKAREESSRRDLASTRWFRRGEMEELPFNSHLLFSRPAVAVEFGLTDVLKYHVEESKVDVNALSASLVEKWGGGEKHLLVHALNEGDFEMFTYLLSRDDIDLHADGCDHDSLFHTVLSPLDQCLRSNDLGDDPARFFRAFVSHPKFSPNDFTLCIEQGGNEFMLSPLQFAVHSSHLALAALEDFRSELLAEVVERFDILLKVGADPALEFQYVSPLAMATIYLVQSVGTPLETPMATLVEVLRQG